MPREHDSSHPEGLTTPEEGWEGARAEKPFRDALADSPALNLTPEEQTALKSVSLKAAEKAIRETREAEKEQGLKLLMRCIKDLEKNWKERGFTPNDIDIISRLVQRLNVYRETMVQKFLEQNQEQKKKPEEIFREMSHMYGRLPVTFKIGTQGGAFYYGRGLGEKLLTSDVNDQDIELDKVKKRIKDTTERGNEFISSSFSPAAEAEFLRALGILEEGQEVADLPGKRESPRYQKYSARLNTNIEGVKVLVSDDPERARDQQAEKGIYLVFSPKFIEKLTSEP